jgi:hypothetical protein
MLQDCLHPPRSSRLIGVVQDISVHIFSRFAASKRMHPMSGGWGRVYRDHVNDYRELRQQRFAFDMLPLPESLPLNGS